MPSDLIKFGVVNMLDFYGEANIDAQFILDPCDVLPIALYI